ncbi:hypothetical protein KQH90_07280 [Anaerosalibacter bizertensis]|uniref:hypothetical protein n=1 Tax=Anaerosalibacter bizertensis TaxID=932217 RepID=UPI001C0EECAC|nr:hypothetical protein [Anaerosalibacter bizertensis]MBU5293835.1 hypothetical protein [Anaerosalibacter bizertensis]
MALVRNFQQLNKQRNSVHKEVDCTYTTFEDSVGNRIFQIDTYGSSDREFVGKVSQSIQLDEESAVKLIKLIQEEFLG